MVLVDAALRKRESEGRPIRVAISGAGAMGRGVTLQIETAVPGMRVVAIGNRTLDRARQAYAEANVANPCVAESVEQVEQAVAIGIPTIMEDARLLSRASGIDCLLEVTGTVEWASQVVTEAIRHGKHVVTPNAELGATLGPLLRLQAERANVVYTDSDGDQPGVAMNLWRFVAGLGIRPVLCGNIKTHLDPYRTPPELEDFARRWGQNSYMVTSFTDGTKLAFEQAITANATGMQVARRGMLGPRVPPGTPIMEAAAAFPAEWLLEGPGYVDYIVGAAPGPGVFVLGACDHSGKQTYLNLFKMGAGPIYCFYTPYHLCHFEVPNSIARAVLFGDATVAPRGGPRVDTVAAAKRDLRAGEILDRLGGFTTYGVCENSATVHRERLLPVGLAEGCRLRRDVSRDSVLTFDDVDRLAHRLSDRLWDEQAQRFFAATGQQTEAAVAIMQR